MSGSFKNPKRYILDLVARLSLSTVAKRIVRGTAWTVAGTAMWRCFSAVSMIVIARVLGPKSFGELGLVTSTVGFAGPLTTLQMGLTSTKYVAQYRQVDPARAARILKLSLITSAILCVGVTITLGLLSPFIASKIFNRPEMANLLLLGSLLIFPMMFASIQQAAIAGFESFRTIARVNAWRGIVQLTACVPLVIFFGIEGAIIGLLISNIIVMLNFGFALRREIRTAHFPSDVSLRASVREMPILWQFALPGTLSALTYAGVSWVAKIMLTHAENGYEQLGLFEAAYQLRLPMLVVPVILAQVVLPILASAYEQGSQKDFRAATALQIQIVCLLSLPIALLIVGFADPLAAIFGDGFRGMGSIISIVAGYAFLQAANQALIRVFDGVGRRWINFAMHLVWAVTLLVSSAFLVPRLNGIGLALSFLLAEMVRLLLQWIYVARFVMPGLLRGQLRWIGLGAILILVASAVQIEVGRWPSIAVGSVLALGVLGLVSIRIWVRRPVIIGDGRRER